MYKFRNRSALTLGREEIKNINDGYSRVIKSRLNKKLQNFTNDELLLLIEKGYVREFRNVAENCNILNEPDRASQTIAVSTLYAPWSGGEQCKQSSCGTTSRIASDRKWQTASSRQRKATDEKYCY